MSPGRAATGEISLQCQGIVMFRIVRAIDESDPAVPRGFANRLKCFRMGIELGEIPALELLPLLRIMGKPAAEFVAWGRVFQPAVDTQLRFFDAARPEPLDQEPDTVIRLRLFIGTL